jgi:hypothetical protein
MNFVKLTLRNIKNTKTFSTPQMCRRFFKRIMFAVMWKYFSGGRFPNNSFETLCLTISLLTTYFDMFVFRNHLKMITYK